MLSMPVCSLISRVFAIVFFGAALSAGMCVSSRTHQAHYAIAHWYVREITSAEVASKLVNPIWVDARKSIDYNLGHIAGALSLRAEFWDEDVGAFLGQFAPERPIVIYCGGRGSGTDRFLALRILSDFGEAEVYVLSGGFPAWQAYRARFDSTFQ
jgi:rhodanese-related sulfurtransferase